MLTKRQLAEHNAGIGGSLAPAILGVDPYISPYQAFLMLTSDYRPPIHDEDLLLFGNILEEPIAQEAAKRLGVKIRRSNITFHHPHHNWMIGHPDRLIVRKHEGLEIKNRSEYMLKRYGEEGTDQMLDSELIQCAHYMAVMDYPVWHLAALVGGNKLRIFRIERNLELEQRILEEERLFWERVEMRDPPEPTTQNDINLRWPRDTGKEKHATSDIAEKIALISKHKETMRFIEKTIEPIELEIKKYIEDATLLSYEGTPLATYKRSIDTQSFDLERFKNENSHLYQTYLKPKDGSRRFILKI